MLQEDLLLALGKYPTSFWPRRKSTCLGFSGSPAAESRSANSGHMPSVSKALVLEQRCFEVLLAGPRVSSFSSVCAGPCPCASTGRWCPLPKLQASPCPSDCSSQRKSPKAGLITVQASSLSLCSLHAGFLECSLDALGRFWLKTS